jgi:hypothetical protein
MNEKLLQYIWQFQYFQQNELFAQNGEPLSIIKPGTHNLNQGPDFLDAKIKTGNTVWAGNIELHVRSSDWISHQHDGDANYKNIILHVVWHDDQAINQPFPVLELMNKVPKLLLDKYHTLMQSPVFIPCEKSIHQVELLVWNHWKERLLVERLLEKSRFILDMLAENNNHWEETFWWALAKSFGGNINGEAFEKIARTIPVNILAKHKNQVQQIEALLLGQANLLTADFKDDYCTMLQKEYRYLQTKYQLQPAGIPLHFLRMRPSSFPTIRLAQLAMLVTQSTHLFSKIIAADCVKTILRLLDVTANDYWHYRYVPDEPSTFQQKNLGRQMASGIIINTVVPVLFAYGMYLNEDRYKLRALEWLEALAAEKNNIARGFAGLGITVKTAFDSQALVQLKNKYCSRKSCLECAAGNSILKKKTGVSGYWYTAFTSISG